MVTAKDHRKYDRAARITATSIDEESQTKLELDINTELLDITPGTNIEVCLASTLSLDGSVDDDRGWRDVAKAQVQTLADGFEYVCYGKVYKFEDAKAAKTLYVDFICPSFLQILAAHNSVLIVRCMPRSVACSWHWRVRITSLCPCVSTMYTSASGGRRALIM